VDTAYSQLDWIDRYLNKNWMDEDYPTDKIYSELSRLYRLESSINIDKDGDGFICKEALTECVSNKCQ